MTAAVTATNRPTWDQIRLAQAQVLATRSWCSRTQVGALITSRDNRIISEGYNGPSRGQRVTGPCADWCPRAQAGDYGAAYDACPAIHAEANALLQVSFVSMVGGTIYVSAACCINCARLIANSRLARLVHVVSPTDAHRDPDSVEEYLRQCGMIVNRATRVEEL